MQGIIWIRKTASGSKSDGNKAYFIDSDLKCYQLYRKGIYEINDDYFYPFHLKTVEVDGEVQRQDWIKVDNIQIINDEFINSK